MKAGRVELFINVMWRELDMLIQQRPAPGSPHAQTLDEIFGSGSWRTEVIGEGMDERLDRAIPLMARGIGARWWTSAVRMVTGGQATRYVLLHLTNSDDGRDLMKECAWSLSPAGGFMVRRSDNPDQQFLIKPEPDLRPLRDWIISRLSRRPERWQDLHAAVRPEVWLPKHVNELVRELKKEGVITADEVPGRKFSAAANPILRLTKAEAVTGRHGPFFDPSRWDYREILVGVLSILSTVAPSGTTWSFWTDAIQRHERCRHPRQPGPALPRKTPNRISSRFWFPPPWKRWEPKLEGDKGGTMTETRFVPPFLGARMEGVSRNCRGGRWRGRRPRSLSAPSSWLGPFVLKTLSARRRASSGRLRPGRARASASPHRSVADTNERGWAESLNLPPIPIARCRVLLGEDGRELSDVEIDALRRRAEATAHIFLQRQMTLS
jgi:hypothetical protein